MKESVDFHKFGDELWNIANVLRADIVKVTEYLEEFSYFLFLKLLDDMERQDEEVANLNGKEYISLIPRNYRFYNWAEDPTSWAKMHGYDSVIDFLNRMSVDLSSIKDEVDAWQCYSRQVADQESFPESYLAIAIRQNGNHARKKIKRIRTWISKLRCCWQGIRISDTKVG